MNRHFQRDQPADWQLPAKVYARLDHVERTARGMWDLLLAFDAVDAQWLVDRARVDARFDLGAPDRALAALAAHPIEPPLRGQGRSPFEDAPLYRIEIEHRIGDPLFDYGQPDFVDTGDSSSGLGALEAAWFVFELNTIEIAGGTASNVYPALFAQPASAYVKGTMPSVQQGKALSSIFSLAALPTITTSRLEQALSVAVADLLAVYDVGQGNSNALLEEGKGYAAPTLYYDLGAGVYRNQHTTPANLVFCFTHKPPILLSHWDADHWAGTYASSVGGNYPALLRDWYAPMQTVGPVHVAFAHDIISAGGSMSTYLPAAGALGSSTLRSAQTLRFAVGSGSDRNNTGIVVAVEDDSLHPRRSWILTGDCDYGYFVSHLTPDPPVGLVAPHHGADLASATQAPAPVVLTNGYCRLMYSFGAGNKHGAKQHPTAAGMQLHASPGWNHGAWSPVTPGLCVAGADVLETEIHGTGGLPGTARGGCLVGWGQVPSPVSAQCAKSTPSCTISPIQA